MAGKGRPSPGGKDVLPDQKSSVPFGHEQEDTEAADDGPRPASAGVLHKHDEDAATPHVVLETAAITENRPGGKLGDDSSSPGNGEAVVPQLPSATPDMEMAVLHAFTVDERQPTTTRTPATTITHAVMVASDDEQRRFDRRRMASLGILSLLLVVVLFVTLTMRRGGNNNKNQSAGEAATAPSPSPIELSLPPTTDRFSDICQEILTHFESPTLEQDLMNPESPQYRAAIWMAEDDEHPTSASLSYPLNQTDLEVLQFRQRYALVTFYFATSTGDLGWKDLCNFLTPSLHVCDWRCSWNSTDTIVADKLGLDWAETDYMGVSCGHHQRSETDPMLDDLVVSLEVGNNNLVGTIPDEIQGLDVLKRLTIFSSWLRGTLPFEALANTMIVKRPLFAEKLGLVAPFGSRVDERSNTSEGVLSSSGASIVPALEELIVYWNQLTGTIPSTLGLFGAMQYLELTKNLFEGDFPSSSLGNLTALQVLSLYDNLLSGVLPSSLGQLPALAALYAGSNQLTGELPSSLGNLTALQSLLLFENQFSGRLSSSLGQLTALTNLDVSTNRFTGKLPSSLGNLTALQRLALVDNQFSGRLPSSLGHLTALTVLGAYMNNFTGELPSTLGNLTVLQGLSLYDNMFSEGLPWSLGQLTALTNLDFSMNRFTGVLPSSLGNLKVLQHLWLYDNLFSGELPSSLGQLTALTTLVAHINNFTGELPSTLGNLTALEALYLYDNLFSGVFLQVWET